MPTSIRVAGAGQGYARSDHKHSVVRGVALALAPEKPDCANDDVAVERDVHGDSAIHIRERMRLQRSDKRLSEGINH